MTLALFPFSWKSVFSFRERSTERLAAVLSTKSRRTRTFATALGAVGKLQTRKVIEVAIEAGWAVGWSVAIDGEVGIGREEVLGANEGLLGAQADFCQR